VSGRNIKIILTAGVLWTVLLTGNVSGAGTSAATILKYLPGPRMEAMANCGGSLDRDFDSSSWNPAVLGTVKGWNISTLYYSAYSDSSVGYLGVGKDMFGGTIAVKWLGYFGGKIKINDYEEPLLHGSSFISQRDMVFTIGYGFSLSDKIKAGAAAKYYMSTLIEKYKASAYAGDLGMFFKTGLFKYGSPGIFRKYYSGGLNFGVSVLNLGTKLSYTDSGEEDPLPFMWRAGAGYPARFNRDHSMLLTIETYDDNESEIRVGFGAEYNYQDQFFLRAGYRINYNIKNFTWGMGFKYGCFKMDYSMGLNSAVNTEHTVLIALKL